MLVTVSKDGAVTLASDGADLTANGHDVPGVLSGVTDVVRRMTAHGVREIVFDAGAAPAGVLGSARILAGRRERRGWRRGRGGEAGRAGCAERAVHARARPRRRSTSRPGGRSLLRPSPRRLPRAAGSGRAVVALPSRPRRLLDACRQRPLPRGTCRGADRAGRPAGLRVRRRGRARRGGDARQAPSDAARHGGDSGRAGAAAGGRRDVRAVRGDAALRRRRMATSWRCSTSRAE